MIVLHCDNELLSYLLRKTEGTDLLKS